MYQLTKSIKAFTQTHIFSKEDEAMYLALVKDNPRALRYMDDPSETLCLTAIENDPLFAFLEYLNGRV